MAMVVTGMNKALFKGGALSATQLFAIARAMQLFGHLAVLETHTL